MLTLHWRSIRPGKGGRWEGEGGEVRCQAKWCDAYRAGHHVLSRVSGVHVSSGGLIKRNHTIKQCSEGREKTEEFRELPSWTSRVHRLGPSLNQPSWTGRGGETQPEWGAEPERKRRQSRGPATTPTVCTCDLGSEHRCWLSVHRGNPSHMVPRLSLAMWGSDSLREALTPSSPLFQSFPHHPSSLLSKQVPQGCA